MKKILFFVVLFGGLFLTGCNNQIETEEQLQTLPPAETIDEEQPIPTVIEDEDPQVDDNSTLESLIVTEGFEFDLYVMDSIPSIKNKYFLVEFTELYYNPIKNEVCFVFSYDDPDYMNANYYMLGREKGTYLTAQQLSYIVSSPTGKHGGCFNFMNKESTYEILIGKVDSDDLNPTSYIEAVASIEFIDRNFNERKHIGLTRINFEPTLDYSYNVMPSITVDLTIEDEDQIIDTVILDLYDEEENQYLESYTILSDQFSFIDGKLVIEDYIINNLAPYMDYLVKVYISGFNGIEQFTNVKISYKSFKSQFLTPTPGTRRHGFFAEIVEIDITSTAATLYYIAVNNQHTVSSTDLEPYTFKLKVYDADNIVRLEKDIDLLEDSTTIPLAYTQIGNKIEIVTDRDDIILYTTTIQHPAPKLVIDYIKDGVLRGTITSGVSLVNFVTILIYPNSIDAHVDEVEITWLPSNGQFYKTLANYSTYQNLESILVFYQINYNTPEGVKFLSRYVWVENRE